MIIINGKRYHFTDKSNEIEGGWITNDTIKELIKVGILVEVKENKEPQPQEEIELLSFDYEKLEENVRDVEFEKEQETRYIVSRIGKHLELLTNIVNQLIKANKKPL